MAQNQQQRRQTKSTLYFLKVAQKFTHDGKEKTRYTEVGRLFFCEPDDGPSYAQIIITEGISVSGKLVAFLPQEREEEQQQSSRTTRSQSLPRGRR